MPSNNKPNRRRRKGDPRPRKPYASSPFTPTRWAIGRRKWGAKFCISVAGAG